MRLFFAIPVPAPVAEALEQARHRLPGEKRQGWRWVDRAELHLTLAFLGEVAPARLAEVQQCAARAAAQSSGPLSLTARDLGTFPAGQRPARVLWAGLEPHPLLLELEQRLTGELLQASLLEPRTKSFTPHITLARRGRGASPLQVDPVTCPWGGWKARELVLVNSRLKNPVGSRHQRLSTWKL